VSRQEAVKKPRAESGPCVEWAKPILLCGVHGELRSGIGFVVFAPRPRCGRGVRGLNALANAPTAPKSAGGVIDSAFGLRTAISSYRRLLFGCHPLSPSPAAPGLSHGCAIREDEGVGSRRSRQLKSHRSARDCGQERPIGPARIPRNHRRGRAGPLKIAP
jgi:hypothetical protein